jgi:hypothetical protein
MMRYGHELGEHRSAEVSGILPGYPCKEG